jgi:thymidylate kinase
MKQKREPGSPLIAIVGPCASGKTTLVKALETYGFHARQLAQEHSYVADMWEQIARPDLLIYLDASYETCTYRKKLDWTREEYQSQIDRLMDARQRCDLYIDTDDSTPHEIVEITLQFLNNISQ